jgi:CheY-like chemotaxis protein
MRILIAEDEIDVLSLYRGALERRGHTVVLAQDGEEALKAFEDSLRQKDPKIGKTYASNFDVVVLDYKMPKKDGMQVAESILKVTPRQRIIFASAFVRDTLMESVKKLDRVVELIQKPFELKTLVDTIEDTEVYAKLQRFNVNIEKIRGLNLSHEELVELMERVGELMKQKFSL